MASSLVTFLFHIYSIEVIKIVVTLYNAFFNPLFCYPSVVLLGIASALFVVRIILVIWRHFKQPLYDDVNPEAMEPMDIAANQKKIFC